MNVIVYGSQYGSAKAYAEELARRTGIEACDYCSVRDINQYQKIIYIGSLYAGGVLGMKKTFEKLGDVHGKKIVIATVGLADPLDQQNVSVIEANMRRQLRPEVYDAAQIFHLRGGIDYSKLSLKHKVMMGLLCKKAKDLPEEEKTAEVRTMIETYNKQVDFVDFGGLDQIAQL